SSCMPRRGRSDRPARCVRRGIRCAACGRATSRPPKSNAPASSSRHSGCGGWARGSDYLGTLLTAGPEQVAAVAARWLGENRAAVLVYRPASAPPFAADGATVSELLGGDRPEPVAPVTRPVATAAVHTGSRAWRHERDEGGASV